MKEKIIIENSIKISRQRKKNNEQSEKQNTTRKKRIERQAIIQTKRAIISSYRMMVVHEAQKYIENFYFENVFSIESMAIECANQLNEQSEKKKRRSKKTVKKSQI